MMPSLTPPLPAQTMLKDKPEDELPKMVVRPYTPISDPAAKGYLDLVVKVGSRMRGEGPAARTAYS